MPPRADRIRAPLYAILLAGMLAGGFQPFFLRIFFVDRTQIAKSMTEIHDQPGYPAFLREVRRRTPQDARVAIVVPARRWAGYSYGYYRASYFLTGREVIPLVDPDERAHLGRVRDADFVAAWRVQPRIPGYEAVWQEQGSVLLERRGR